MANPNVLITAGCSFSSVPSEFKTWPVHLKTYLKPARIFYLGQGAVGNGIISRRVIYNVSEQLKTYKPEEILVGIMWSSRARTEIFSQDPIIHNPMDFGPTHANPVSIAKNKNFYLLNTHWTDELTTNYYKNIYNDDNATLVTLEHILRVQWFLKVNHINYFMTQYGPDTLPTGILNEEKKIMSSLEVKHLYDMIDKNYWLPINNMQEFANNSGYPYEPGNIHPTTEQHKYFTDTIVIPYLKNKGYIE